MIKVERPALPDDIKKIMDEERADAEAYHKPPFDKKKPPYPFKAYKNKRLGELLQEVFHSKCAYCESSMAAVQPQDVEHFRPKQAVLINGALDKPGYYWLASHWPNLLSSCIYCNRPNRHKIGSKAAARALGKGNEFPLEVEANRARSHTIDIAQEKPLLLDPCVDEPSEHLTFFCNGWIEARKDDAGIPSSRGSKTIDILALQRPGLKNERHARATLILGDLVMYDALEAEVAKGEGSRTNLALATVRIDQYLKDNQPYLGMARQLIEGRKPGLIEMLPKILNSGAPEINEAKKQLAAAIPSD
ncbi:hypothetical protein [Rhizobium sp. C4]|uniref:hypothetical protein n=1 Tax=Rhizobium sp. C4 TaxID=1349800 RepID=UPI001E2A7EDE|nr:hypothetical protein [Rhizobium sp. C4]MCD2175046.1 hypothetical protein [Rhizobium sp. C4]